MTASRRGAVGRMSCGGHCARQLVACGGRRDMRWRWQRHMCPWCRCIQCVPMHIHVWPDPPSPPAVILRPMTMPCAVPTCPCPLPPVHLASQPPSTWPGPLSHSTAPIHMSQALPTCPTLLPCVLGPTLMSWAPFAVAHAGPLPHLQLPSVTGG